MGYPGAGCRPATLAAPGWAASGRPRGQAAAPGFGDLGPVAWTDQRRCLV